LPSDKRLEDEWCAGIPVPDSRSLEQRLTVLEGEDMELFLRFMRKMLQWEPEKRSSAAELAKDEWILKHTAAPF
jgi:serine/threonine-protein kinase SRPK3